MIHRLTLMPLAKISRLPPSVALPGYTLFPLQVTQPSGSATTRPKALSRSHVCRTYLRSQLDGINKPANDN